MSVEIPEQDNSEELAAMSDEDFLNSVNSAETVAPAPDTETSVSAEQAQAEEAVVAETLADAQSTVDTSTEAVKTVDVNYEEFFKTITKPFKANGKDFQVLDPNDAISLMQKGTDYVKKMTEIKPLRRIGKLLEENKLSEDDLAYLIDLKNKKPEAIAKLLKDSEVDLYGFDVEQGNDYAPVAPVVNEVDDALQSTLDDLQANSASFSQTIAVVGQQWDVSSRETVAQHPQLLRVLDAQVANGTFAKIDSVMQYERALGRLEGMTDIQAYAEIERRLQAAQPQTPPIVQAPIVIPAVSAPQANAQQQKLAEQRRQAAPPRQTKVESKPTTNLPAMSDEEFMKHLAQAGL
jgi:hypothetical protein